MTSQIRPSEQMKKLLADIEAGRPPRPHEPEQTIPGQPKGR